MHALVGGRRDTTPPQMCTHHALMQAPACLPTLRLCTPHTRRTHAHARTCGGTGRALHQLPICSTSRSCCSVRAAVASQMLAWGGAGHVRVLHIVSEACPFFATDSLPSSWATVSGVGPHRRVPQAPPQQRSSKREREMTHDVVPTSRCAAGQGPRGALARSGVLAHGGRAGAPGSRGNANASSSPYREPQRPLVQRLMLLHVRHFSSGLLLR
jgi:hypothetical protein